MKHPSHMHFKALSEAVLVLLATIVEVSAAPMSLQERRQMRVAPCNFRGALVTGFLTDACSSCRGLHAIWPQY